MVDAVKFKTFDLLQWYGIGENWLHIVCREGHEKRLDAVKAAHPLDIAGMGLPDDFVRAYLQAAREKISVLTNELVKRKIIEGDEEIPILMVQNGGVLTARAFSI